MAAHLSKAEETLALHIRLHKLPAPEREYRFHETRKWRFDFAWPTIRLAVEVEGLTRESGRHQRIEGFEKDLEKYESAMLDGWTIYRCSHSMIKSARAIETLEILIGKLLWESK